MTWCTWPAPIRLTRTHAQIAADFGISEAVHAQAALARTAQTAADHRVRTVQPSTVDGDVVAEVRQALRRLLDQLRAVAILARYDAGKSAAGSRRAGDTAGAP